MALAEVFVGSDASYQVEGSSAFCWGFLCILDPLKPEIVEVDSSATATPLLRCVSSSPAAGCAIARPAGQATIG